MGNENEKLTIEEAQQKVDEWIRIKGKRYFKELTNTAILMEEVGELARYMSRIYGEQSFKEDLSLDQAKQKMADEMADVLFVLMCLANQTDVDLTQAFYQNLKKKTDRDGRRHWDNPDL